MSNPLEIRIAVFGGKGSGKTTLLASYYGNQQKHDFRQKYGYYLACVDGKQGMFLLGNYYKLEAGHFPPATDAPATYEFDFMINELTQPSLRIVWSDYPGGWWEYQPKDAEERAAKEKAIGDLINSHVGILLIDGQKYSKDGSAYLKATLNQFVDEIRKVRRSLASNAQYQVKQKEANPPENWIICLTKADLLPAETNAENICTRMWIEAQDALGAFHYEMNDPGQSSHCTFGKEFLLLSSVKAPKGVPIDPKATLGLKLIAPISLVSILEYIHKKSSKGTSAKVVSKIFESLKGLLTMIDRLDDFLPKKYQFVTQLIQALHLEESLELGVLYFRDKQFAAAKRGKALEAGIAAMKAELASDEADRAYFRTHF